MTIFLGSDHGGFELKEHLKKFLSAHEVVDFGATGLDPADDYPTYAFRVAQAVAGDKNSLGILLCRSGQGVCVVANKINNVRAGIAWTPELARFGRRDDHINVLCLPSDFITKDEAEKIVNEFLNEEPGKEGRFLRRLKEISAIEHHEEL